MSENGEKKVPAIFGALLKAMTEIGAVGKDRKNEQQHYKFRGIEDVMNAAQPALIRAGVLCVPRVLENTREERQGKSGGTLFYCLLRVEHTFFAAADGSSVAAVTVGEAMDSGDKATNKAMSAAYKYALVETLCIPTQDLRDSEDDSPEPAPSSRPAPPADSGRKAEQLMASIKADLASAETGHQMNAAATRAKEAERRGDLTAEQVAHIGALYQARRATLPGKGNGRSAS